MKLAEDQIRQQLSSFVSNYRIELVFILVSLILSLGSFLVFWKASTAQKTTEIKFSSPSSPDFPIASAPARLMYVDISGAVEKPGLYEIKEGSRLQNLLEKANGLSKKADRIFFAQHFNLAKVVVDQEKIYIPSVQEVEEAQYDNLPIERTGAMVEGATASLININAASEKELDMLPGVGPVTAQKMIEARPYGSLEDLLAKKIVSERVYGLIQDKITAQ